MFPRTLVKWFLRFGCVSKRSKRSSKTTSVALSISVGSSIVSPSIHPFLLQDFSNRLDHWFVLFSLAFHQFVFPRVGELFPVFLLESIPQVILRDCIRNNNRMKFTSMGISIPLVDVRACIESKKGKTASMSSFISVSFFHSLTALLPQWRKTCLGYSKPWSNQERKGHFWA